MNREDFLTGLARLLESIPEAERQEALDYYNNYFDDAGPENEAMVIQELGGTPDKVAASILAEFQSGKTGRQNYGEYTEQGYRDTRIPRTGQMPQTVPKKTQKTHSRPEFFKDNSTLTKTILIVLILIATSGIWLGFLGGLAGLVFGVLGGILSLILGLAAAIFAMLVAGISMICIGIAKCLTNPALGLLISGLGMLLLALGILLLILLVWAGSKYLPRFIRWGGRCLSRLWNWCKTKWELFNGKE